MDTSPPPRTRVKTVRTLLWLLIALAIAGMAAILLLHRGGPNPPVLRSAKASFGGPFTLTGADGKPFASARLLGKPYALYFGFTRCADECPTTLQRLVKLRRSAASDSALNIVFITIDPKNDGPKEVGQYAQLFGAPMIGLTGSPAQIEQVKKQYGIYAEPTDESGTGHEIAHTSTVLLFDRDGKLAGTITSSEPDSSALTTIKQLTS